MKQEGMIGIGGNDSDAHALPRCADDPVRQGAAVEASREWYQLSDGRDGRHLANELHRRYNDALARALVSGGDTAEDPYDLAWREAYCDVFMGLVGADIQRAFDAFDELMETVLTSSELNLVDKVLMSSRATREKQRSIRQLSNYKFDVAAVRDTRHVAVQLLDRLRKLSL